MPAKIQELDQELADSFKEYNAAASRLEELQKSYREKEAELADYQEHVKEREAKLYMIKTNKEYQAAVSEIAERKRHNKELENQMLAIMEETEGLEKKVAEDKPAFDAKAQELAEQKAELEASIGELKARLEERQNEWEQKTHDIDQELLARYNEARGMNRDAIAMLEGKSCQGCFVNVPPQLVIEVLRLETLHSCPSCQRLLFIKEAVEDEGIETPTE